jgi:glycosyltransferase involved in cell wall biosynthesis
MTPRVSILIPAYNAERWIAETLKSALAQDYPNCEIIVVDDGSKDRTLEIARHYESSAVRVIHQKNAGGPAARNTALANARGDYIQWLDHDDLLAGDKISVQMRALEGESERLLVSGPFGTFYYRPEKASFTSGPLWRDMSPLEYFRIKFSGNTYFQSSCWLASRRLTDAAGPWWEVRSPDDDGEYFCRIVAASERIRFVPEAKCYWRVGNYGSFSGAWARSTAAQEATFKSMCRCIEHCRNLDDTEPSRAACIRFLQDRLIYFYPDNPGIVEQARELAKALGGDLALPRLTWKYTLVRKAFGWKTAKRVQILCPQFRVVISREWDKLMWNLAGSSAAFQSLLSFHELTHH